MIDLPRHPRRAVRGFTLIELVLVLALLAVMLAMVAPSMRGFGRGQTVENAADRLLAEVARARSDAATLAVPHRLQIDPGGRAYQILKDDVDASEPTGVDSLLVGAGSLGSDEIAADAVVLPEGVRLTATDLDGMALEYVEFGVDGRITPVYMAMVGPNDKEILIEARGVADSLRRVDPGVLP